MTTADIDQPLVPRWLWRLMAVAAIALVVSIGVRLTFSWFNYGDLNHRAPGTWIALAIDARDGILYRPIASPIGYGGTRYTPVLIVMEALLLKLGMNSITSGFLLGLIAAVLLICGLFTLMRRLGVPLVLAMPMAFFALSAACFRDAILGIRGDLLPVAFNLWGLTAIVWSVRRLNSAHRWLGIFIGAICFALAIGTKVTSIFGVGTAVLWLLSQRRFRVALGLFAAWVGLLILGVLLTQWASDGRALTILRICAGGGGGLKLLLHGPQAMVSNALRSDHYFLCFWIIALFLLLFSSQWLSLSAILFAMTTVGTMFIFGSLGTHANHLIDLNVASVLVVGTQPLKSRLFGLIQIIVCAVVVFASVTSLREAANIRATAQRSQMESALAETDLSPVRGPILSQVPLLPILRGERPYVLDPFAFRTARLRQPAIADRLWQELANHYFKAVITNEPANDPEFKGNLGDFGPGFISHLEKDYHLTSIKGDYFVYLPNDPRSSPEMRQKY